jgi:hypothetical protein
MPYPDHSNKPASNLLANRLASKLKNIGESPPVPQPQQPNKQLKTTNSGESSSSPQPQQIQSSGESSKEVSTPVIERADTFDKSEIHNVCMGPVEPFPTVTEIEGEALTNNMSSDDDSFKPAKASRRRSSDGVSGGKKKKSSRRKSQKDREEKKKKSVAIEESAGDDTDDKANGDAVRDRKMRNARDVSFSGSTIKRVKERESIQDSTDSLHSALKPSKYGRSSSGGSNASVDAEAEGPKLSFSAVATAATLASSERRKSMFKRAAGASMSDLTANNGMQDPPAANENQGPPRRLNSEPYKPSDEPFPKFEQAQCRQSAPNLVKRKSIGSLDCGTSGTIVGRSRKTVFKGIGRARSSEHLRRSAMSTDDQIYV